MVPLVQATRIGVVAGVPQELDALLPGAARAPAGTAALPVHRVERSGRTLFLACGGIGKVAAATAAALLHGVHRVEGLAVTGTAGNLAGLAPGAYAIVEALQADFGAQRDGALVRYSAGAWPLGPASLEPLVPDLVAAGPPQARIATSDLFVECAVHAGSLRAALGVELVDMETAAVAQAARLLGVPWLAIKAVTDEAGAGSGAAFQANLAAAARAAAAAMERALGFG